MSVLVKTNGGTGLGDTEGEWLWESIPTDNGEMVRLDRTPDGRLWFTFTDAEEFAGAYFSVQVFPGDLDDLAAVLAEGVA